jgi:site-specific DNA-cytosine methylase
MPQVRPEHDPLLKARLQSASKNIDQHRMQAFDTIVKHLVNDLASLRPEGEEFIKAFVANHRVPKRHIRAHLDFQSTLGPIAAGLREGRLDLETLVMLLKLGEAARDEVMRFIEHGHPTDASEVTRIAADWRGLQKTDDEAHHQEALRMIGRDRVKKLRRDAISFRRTARTLHKLLGGFDELAADAKPAAREEIMSLSGSLHARFRTEISDKVVPMEDWGTIANPAARKLAEAEYALRVLAGGEFGDRIPTIDPSADFPPHYTFRAKGLPSWSATASIGFLARKPSPTSERHKARPVTKLSAVDISAGIGAKSLALRSAGFFLRRIFEADEISVEVIKYNRPSWPVQQLALNDFDAIQDAMKPVVQSLRGGQLDLIVGGMPLKPWKAEGTDKAYQEEANLALMNMVETYDPRAFFVEIDENLLKDGQIEVYQWMTTFFSKRGYHLDVFKLPYPDYGIPQKRTGTYLVGIKEKYADRLRRPIVRRPQKPSAVDMIADVAFPHRSEPSSAQKKTTLRQQKYNEWSSEWLDNGPKLVGNVRHAWSTSAKDDWRRYRIDLDSKHDAAVPVGKLPETSMLPLTTSIIKRWQGIPNDWKVAIGKRKGGKITNRRQAKMLCAETPPVITLAVARSIHAALTGEYVDLDSPGALTLSMSHFIFHPIDPYGVPDPKQHSAEIWKNGVRAMLGLDRSHRAQSDFDDSDFDDCDFDDCDLPSLGDAGRAGRVLFRKKPVTRQKRIGGASKRKRLNR